MVQKLCILIIRKKLIILMQCLWLPEEKRMSYMTKFLAKPLIKLMMPAQREI